VTLFGQAASRLPHILGGYAADGPLRKVEPSELAGVTLVIDGAGDWLGPTQFADNYAEMGNAKMSVSFAGVTILRESLREWHSELSGKTSKKRGPKPRYDWEALKQEAFRLLATRGDFDSSKPDWNAQARLEEELLNWCDAQSKPAPARTRLKDHIRQWLTGWRQKKK
jgi:hypothetical protein